MRGVGVGTSYVLSGSGGTAAAPAAPAALKFNVAANSQYLPLVAL